MKDIFIDAITKRVRVEVKFNSKENGIITRSCIPLDFGPSAISKNKSDKFHFYDLTSLNGSHALLLSPEQVIEIVQTNIAFDPANYIAWIPRWIIPRDWGYYS